MAGDEIFDSIRLRKDGVDSAQWPKLSCTDVSQLTLESSVLQITGSIKATSFQGDGSTLDGVVKKTGDTISGTLAIQNNLFVTGNLSIGSNNPTAKLHIYAPDDDALKITNTTLSKTARMGVDHLGVWIEPTETDSSIRLNANPHLLGLYINGADGNVGIGTTSPAFKLDVAGEVHASNFPTTSDSRLKTNVTQLTSVLEKIEKIRGISFEWNKVYESLGRSTSHREIGVSAQEVELVFPELVTTWGDEGYKAVDYGRLTGILVEAVKELKIQNDALKQRVESLEEASKETEFPSHEIA